MTTPLSDDQLAELAITIAQEYEDLRQIDMRSIITLLVGIMTHAGKFNISGAEKKRLAIIAINIVIDNTHMSPAEKTICKEFINDASDLIIDLIIEVSKGVYKFKTNVWDRYCCPC